MGLNKRAGNMYEFVTHTWNPLGGKCPHECGYCYVEDLKKNPTLDEKYSGDPELYEKELEYPHTHKDFPDGLTIFVCNMTDLFAEGVPNGIIKRILKRCRDHQQNTYLFQTKNPARFLDFTSRMPGNSILCTTMESNRDYADTKAPSMERRMQAMSWVKAVRKYYPKMKVFLTIEPIMDFDVYELLGMIYVVHPDMVSIGADSEKCGLPEPESEKVAALIKTLKGGPKVYLKDNLKRLLHYAWKANSGLDNV